MMSTVVAPSFSPHPAGLQQHPGVPQGHPMAGVHPQQGVPPGQGMPQQAFQMAVSGPGGPHMTQPGAMMGGIPPGMAGPGGANAHAMQHLNPNQAMFQQQQQQQQQLAFANNPQLQQMAAQQQMIQQRTQQQHVQARQAMLAQQQFNGGVPMNMPNGMNPGMNMNATAQFAQMRGQPGPRPPVGVPLPGHLQQLQQEATHQSQQQAQQAQLHQQQQQHQQQLLAMQMQSAAHGGQPGPNQMNSQQMQNLRQMAVVQQQQQAHLQQQQQQAQQAQQQAQANQQQAQQQAHEQQQQQAQHQQQVSQEQAAAAVAARQSQVQAQQQQNQANPQTSQPQGPQQVISQAQQQAMNPAMMRMRMAQQQQQQQQMQMQQKLPSILRLHAFADNLGQYINSSSKPPTDLSYWMNFVAEFFSPSGIFRPVLWMAEEAKSKQYEISYPAIARYFNTHFDSGVTNMQLIVQAAVERPLGDGATHISSEKSSFIYWFENKSQLVAHGKLKVIFNDQQKIELLEFETTHHEEYLPRGRVVEAARPLHEWQKEWQRLNAAPDGKQSPEVSKKKAKPMKSPQTSPPEIDIPESKVKANMGITPGVFQFLELAEVMGQMNPLFAHSHSHTALRPYGVLDQYVEGVARQQAMNPALQNMNPNLQPRAPSGAFASPANNQIGLPDGSTPNMMMQGSPALGNMAAPPMQMQQSQQGSSSGMSANTSPNVNNKRRRMSVKDEEAAQVNGTPQMGAAAGAAGGAAKVKPSPRIGGKRQKGAPA